MNVVNKFIQNVARWLGILILSTTLTADLVSPVAADDITVPHTFGPQFFDIVARNKVIQSNNNEKTAVIWEVDGKAFCSHTPPTGIENGFQFTAPRWTSSGTNPGTLAQGDPMVLTYSIVPDGTQGVGFTCGVSGEIAGAPSDLIAFLDSAHGAGPGGSDLTLRPWFPIFKSAFENWGALNGVKYTYEANDDGAGMGGGGATGVLGVRGDLRIGGHFIDGQQVGANVLACNYFPSNGDMILDTGNTAFYGPAAAPQLGFRNVLEHEHGHGMGISHVCPINQTKLMEPFISFDFLGAQEDDILAANRGYGDRDEFPAQNDTSATATPLGAIATDGSVTRTKVSIDGTSDQDYYSFVAPVGAYANITVTPTGSTYLSGPQIGACDTGTSFNSLIESNLGFQLRGQSGVNVLASANAVAAGGAEQTFGTLLSEGAGTYFVRVFGAQDKAQMYDLSIELTGSQPPPPPPPPPSEDFCTSIKMLNNKVVTFCL